jgi:flagellar basal-body rod modification protein FlgD
MANTLNINSSTTVSTTDPFAPRAGAPSSASNTQVTKNMFLQLLVAQIKNQDPLNPSDSEQYLTQLAQFQQLENGINMGQDITAIRTDMDKLSGSSTAGTSTETSSGAK